MRFWVLTALLCAVALTNAFDDTTCGTTKQCLKNPENCDVTQATCMFFSYAYNASTQSFTFELSGSAGGGANYVAVGFSPTGLMENSDVYYCIGTSLRSAVIQSRTSRTTISTASLPTGVAEVTSGTNSGVAECEFTRAASITKTIEGGVNEAFNLVTTNYQVILASGTYTAPEPDYHGDNRIALGSTNFTVMPGVTTPAPPSGNDLTTGCGTTKGCFRSPANCQTTSTACRFVSFSYNSAANTFDIEIFGGTGSTDQYAAIAFAPSGRMENADMYYCSNAKFQSAVITANQQPPTDLPTQAGISNEQFGTNGGALYCTFTRSASITKAEVNIDFNLQTTPYFLLVAVGTVNAGGGVTYHGTSGRVGSDAAIDFTQNVDIGGTGGKSFDLVKAHACLMLIAWMTCVSIGVIIARHFKPLWHGSTCFDTKIWFQIHRTLMITALLCTVIAFILIFVFKEGYSDTAGAHPILGIIVTALCIINPVMAVFRPHPNTPKRPIFNWGHFLVGSLARVLAIAAIFLGVDLQLLNLPEWDTWVLVGFVCFHVVTEIVLEILSAVYEHIPAYKREKNGPEEISMGHADSADNPPQGAAIKYIVLLIYVVGNLGFLITFIVGVAQVEG